MDYQRPKGTTDILPGKTAMWQAVEREVNHVMHVYDYQEIRTPIFEDYTVFARSVGDTSDIVTKEMYDFLDKGNRRVTLRPEGTAGVVRAYVENKLYAPEYIRPYKVYYIGPMFRYERPQSGRQRQFHQIGVEALNGESPQIDVEIIQMGLEIFDRLKVKDIKLVLNTLGNKESRDAYRSALVSYLEPLNSQLSKDSQERLKKNPLRILDSKDPQDKEIVANAPSILDYLDEESTQYFESVKKLLDEQGISYEIDSTMVRGLDYYTHIIFEIMSQSSVFDGNWMTICAGGRYDSLISEFNGPDAGGCGFAIGVERLILLLEKENPHLADAEKLRIFVASADEKGDDLAFSIVSKLRHAGISADKNYSGSRVKSQLKEAIKKNAEYYMVLGESEVNGNPLLIHQVDSPNTTTVTMEELLNNPHHYLSTMK